MALNTINNCQYQHFMYLRNYPDLVVNFAHVIIHYGQEKVMKMWLIFVILSWDTFCLNMCLVDQSGVTGVRLDPVCRLIFVNMPNTWTERFGNLRFCLVI